MEIFQVILLIEHDNNGVSLLRGVFSKWSVFVVYFNTIITPLLDMDEVGSELADEGKYIYLTRDASWEIISANIDEELQILIDNG